MRTVGKDTSSSCLSNIACSPSRVESSSVILNMSIMVGLEVRGKSQQLLQLLGNVQSILLISHPLLLECCCTRQMTGVEDAP